MQRLLMDSMRRLAAMPSLNARHLQIVKRDVSVEILSNINQYVHTFSCHAFSVLKWLKELRWHSMRETLARDPTHAQLVALLSSERSCLTIAIVVSFR